MVFLFGSITNDTVDKHLSLLTQMGPAGALARGGRAALLLPQHQGEESTPGCATPRGKLQNNLPNCWEALTVKWAHHTPVSAGSRNTSFILGSCLCLHFPQFCLHWCYTGFFSFSLYDFVFFFSFVWIKGKILMLHTAFYLVVILELHLSVLTISHNCEQL